MWAQGAHAHNSSGRRVFCALVSFLLLRSIDASPQWLEDYIKFHAENKYAANATYLVHVCWTPVCGGTGDRFRGILWSTRLAAARRRILLVQWRQPAPLTYFFIPNRIDWSVGQLEGIVEQIYNGTYDANNHAKLVFVHRGFEGPPELIEGKLDNKKLWALEHNMREHMNIGKNALPLEPWSMDGHNIFKALFKPSAMVMQQIQAQLKLLFGTEHPSYVAGHLRIGGMVGEDDLPDYRQPSAKRLQIMYQTLRCLRQFRRANIIGSHAALLITDNNTVRNMTAENLFTGVKSTINITAVHIDSHKGGSPLDHVPSIAEMGLLAAARCVVLTDSGYSRMAFYWGGQTCKVLLNCGWFTNAEACNEAWCRKRMIH